MTLPTANLKSVNRYGGTALIPAAHHGHPDAVRVLLGTAIDKDHVNKLGWTALLEAVILGDGGPVHTEMCGCWWRPVRTSTSRTAKGHAAAACAAARLWRDGADLGGEGREESLAPSPKSGLRIMEELHTPRAV